MQIFRSELPFEDELYSCQIFNKQYMVHPLIIFSSYYGIKKVPMSMRGEYIKADMPSSCLRTQIWPTKINCDDPKMI